MGIWRNRDYAVYTSKSAVSVDDGDHALAIVTIPQGFHLFYFLPFVSTFLLLFQGFYLSTLISLLGSLFWLSKALLSLKLIFLTLCAYTIGSLNEYKLERSGYQLATVMNASNADAVRRTFLLNQQRFKDSERDMKSAT